MIDVDVGYGQLHPRLRGDPRVTVLRADERPRPHGAPTAPDLLVCDVSFISVRTALPPALRLAAPGWEAVVLEAPVRGRAQRRQGRRRPRPGRAPPGGAGGRRGGARVGGAGRGGRRLGVPGPKGNREVFLHLVHDPHAALPDDIDDWIASAVP